MTAFQNKRSDVVKLLSETKATGPIVASFYDQLMQFLESREFPGHSVYDPQLNFDIDLHLSS